MKSKTRLIIIVVLLAITVGAFVGYRMWNKPHTTVEDVKALQVTAAELCRAFEENEAEANKRYVQKAIEVTGTVGEVTNNQDGFPSVILHGGESSTEIVCTMREKNVAIQAGGVVTIKGFFTDYDGMFGIKITDCIVVK